MEGRQILDSVILVHEVVHSLKVTKKPGMLLKLYISKGYNKFNWQFVREMLKAYGISREWIAWIMNMTSSAFFSILLNGAPTNTFRPTQGIRQGDPLSPLLFILMETGLSRLIKVMTESDEMKGLNPHNGSDKQMRQQFVDDTMLMGHPSVQEARVFRKCLSNFLKASGLEIKSEKSQVFFIL